MRERWKRWLLIVCVNVMVVFIASEGILRVAARISAGSRRLLHMREAWPGQDYRDFDDVVQLVNASPWSLGPFGNCFGYILNSKGFRTAEYRYAREPGVRRVVMLGDSFFMEAAGVPDEDHIATRMGVGLNLSARTEVINLGVEGMGPKFYLRLLEIEGRKLRPDAIVIGFFVGNDLTDEPVPGWSFSWDVRLAMHVYSYRLLRNLYRRVAFVANPGSSVRGRARQEGPTSGGKYLGYPGTWPPPPYLTREAFLKMQLDRRIIYSETWLPQLKAQWTSVRRTLARMQDIAREEHVQLLLVLIPDETQVNPDLQRWIEETMPEETFDYLKPQAVIEEYCGSNGIAVLDLLPAFLEAAANGEALYQPQDSHWNPHGQRFAATLIVRALEAQLAAR